MGTIPEHRHRAGRCRSADLDTVVRQARLVDAQRLLVLLRQVATAEATRWGDIPTRLHRLLHGVRIHALRQRRRGTTLAEVGRRSAVELGGTTRPATPGRELDTLLGETRRELALGGGVAG